MKNPLVQTYEHWKTWLYVQVYPNAIYIALRRQVQVSAPIFYTFLIMGILVPISELLNKGGVNAGRFASPLKATKNHATTHTRIQASGTI